MGDLATDLAYTAVFLALALILAFGLYETIGTALGTDIPVVAVTSGSMEPEMSRGDLIIVRGTPFDELEPGDVVVFDTCLQVPLIHRVIDRGTETLETKGDANRQQVEACMVNEQQCVPPEAVPSCPQDRRVNVEQGITEDQVLGEAFFVVPEIGRVKLEPTCLYYQLIGVENTGMVC